MMKRLFLLIAISIIPILSVLYVGIDDGQLLIPTVEKRKSLEIPPPVWTINDTTRMPHNVNFWFCS